jgi:hypothetical protein
MPDALLLRHLRDWRGQLFRTAALVLTTQSGYAQPEAAITP